MAEGRYLMLAPILSQAGGCLKSRRRLIVATETLSSFATWRSVSSASSKGPFVGGFIIQRYE